MDVTASRAASHRMVLLNECWRAGDLKAVEPRLTSPLRRG
jgi:hypothetical protein